MNFSNMKIGTKIQLAIATNVILAIVIGDFAIREVLKLDGITGIAANLAINGVIAFIYGLVVSRAITRPLKSVTQVLHVLAKGDGDLTKRLTLESKDEVGQLAHDFNTFLDKLHSIISQVSSSTHRLAKAAADMQEITNESAAHMNQQQSETEQAASAMNQMAMTVAEVTRNAAEAEQSAHDADRLAREGADISSAAMQGINHLVHEVETTANAIEALAGDVQNIGVILDVIKDITEQTNLLALNAAIEAARAGEAGRGFAVVADEVRTLASRTQDSTTEIEQVINKLQAAAQHAMTTMEEARAQGQNGSQKVSQANDSLTSIAESVNKIAAINTQIAAAAEQQHATTNEVNRNISSINSSTDVTSAGTARTVQTSHELNELAHSLEQLVDQFKLSA